MLISKCVCAINGLTEKRRFVPIAVTHLHVIVLAVVPLEDVELGYVEQDPLAVGGGDAPLAPFALLGNGAGREDGRRERGLVLLKRPAAL